DPAFLPLTAADVILRGLVFLLIALSAWIDTVFNARNISLNTLYTAWRTDSSRSTPARFHYQAARILVPAFQIAVPLLVFAQVPCGGLLVFLAAFDLLLAVALLVSSLRLSERLWT
nr:hypothetical protein [Anaerolineae bacterium]